MPFIYSGNQEIYYIFKTFCIISVLFCTKFIISCSNNMFFINHVLKFKYQPHCLNVTLKGHLVFCHIIIFAIEISVVFAYARYVRWLVTVCKILNMWEWCKMEETFTAVHCNIFFYMQLCFDGTLLHRTKPTAYCRIRCQFILSTYVSKVLFSWDMTVCLWV
jgi:hypothetical protein